MSFRAITKAEFDRVDVETQKAMIEEGLYDPSGGAEPGRAQRTTDEVARLIAELEEAVAAFKAREQTQQTEIEVLKHALKKEAEFSGVLTEQFVDLRQRVARLELNQPYAEGSVGYGMEAFTVGDALIEEPAYGEPVEGSSGSFGDEPDI